MDLVDAELNVVRTVDNLEPENVASVVQLGDTEVAVGPAYSSDLVGSAVAVSLADPSTAPDVVVGPDTGYPYPPPGTNRGGTGQPGTPSLALAITGSTVDGADTVLDGEVVVVDLETSTVARLAHHRASSDSAFSRPLISMSPSGRHIVFASDWGGDATNLYLLYQP